MDSPASETVELLNTSSAQTGQYSAEFEDTADLSEQQSPLNDDDADQSQKPAATPMQKRRRVTRACDECRRKKIKCDGKQPCTHCTVYSYECTYDQPSNRRRNAPPQYIEALETQLKRAKALLSIVLPTIDLSDPNLDVHLQNGVLPHIPLAPPQSAQPMHDARMSHRREDQSREEPQDPYLESMVKATGQLDLDEEGNWDYHGHSSGLMFMRRLQQQFGEIISPPAPGSPFNKLRPMSQLFDTPTSAHPSPADSSSVLPAGTELPPKIEARVLCENALVDAGALMRVVHIPTFYRSLDRIYETPPEHYGHEENTFLPLLYAVLALGTLFRKRDGATIEVGWEASADEGFKFFRASRQMLDIADCRDLTSLQAIVFHIQFLQSSAKLSTCYAYIGIALRSALRMGLHRSFNKDFTPIEAEIRKRLFWTIRKMDIYVAAMLGLPIFLKDEDVDQDWPTEVDDEYITNTEILPAPEGKIAVTTACNAHTSLVMILAKICKYVYPIKGTQSGGKNSVTYTVSYSKIREIEQDLQQWSDRLPLGLRPGSEATPNMIRIQQLLRMAFSHAHILLYRPFLHYVSQSFQNKPVDQRAIICASSCINIARNIIHITSDMKNRGLLVGAYWFSMYTTFFAIISMLYYALENPNSATSQELFREAMEGKETLAHFAKRSMAADRCTAALSTIFDKLPESIKQGGQKARPNETLKRRQGSSPQSLHSRPSSFKQDDFVASGLRRASTFPESMPTNKLTAPSLPVSQAHLATLGIDPAYGQSPSQAGSDMYDPAPSLTPTSTTTSNVGSYGISSSHTPQQRPLGSFSPTPMTSSFVGSTGLNVPLSDVSAMMFPSTDPFAYPNQPMTTFENNNMQQAGQSPTITGLPLQGSNMDIKPQLTAFSPGIANVPMGPRRMNEADVQLFGPMPMYLMHGTQQQAPRGFAPQHQPQVPMTSTPDAGNMQFDELFGGEEWANTFMDQGLGLSGAGSGYPSNTGFAPGDGSGMMHWR